MKNLIFLFYLVSLSSFSQSKELYDLAFDKKENFELLKIFGFGGKVPKKFLIIDSTITWNPKTFYLENIDLENPKVIENLHRDEHHPYHSSYLFSDKTLNQLIDSNEKENLSKKSSLVSSKEIQIQGRNYSTIKKFDKKGFYFFVSEPLYSTNEKFAFIHITVYQKEVILNEERDDYFASMTIMFAKNSKGNWEQIGIKKRIIQ